MAGGSNLQSTMSGMKASFSQRAMSFFKGTTQTFTNIQVAPGIFNKNLKPYLSSEAENKRSLSMNRGKHQLFITSLYNKAVMLHLCPITGEIFLHELDPNNQFKYTQSIRIPGNDLHAL